MNKKIISALKFINTFISFIYQIYNKNKKLSEIQRVLNVDPQGL